MMGLPALPGDRQERATDSTHSLTGNQRHRQTQRVAMGLPASRGEATPSPQPRPPSRDAELHRLIWLQHMSDEVLVKHAAEVQSPKGFEARRIGILPSRTKTLPFRTRILLCGTIWSTTMAQQLIKSS